MLPIYLYCRPPMKKKFQLCKSLILEEKSPTSPIVEEEITFAPMLENQMSSLIVSVPLTSQPI